MNCRDCEYFAKIPNSDRYKCTRYQLKFPRDKVYQLDPCKRGLSPREVIQFHKELNVAPNLEKSVPPFLESNDDAPATPVNPAPKPVNKPVNNGTNNTNVSKPVGNTNTTRNVDDVDMDSILKKYGIK